MFLCGIPVALALQAAQPGNEAGPGRARFDHLIEESAGRGNERIRQLVSKLPHALLAERVGIVGRLQFSFVAGC